jgi:hypothetical protein
MLTASSLPCLAQRITGDIGAQVAELLAVQ